ncbi:hypothetical protein J1N35_014208 [Gossypium stocksii]|uniref:Ycf20-like protein n=1 Tax=Gossypium stocksii TaxID=47602 RepID=A0A9D3VUI1_9ROSI|nr:hypothetical protein J1N35_014208 [Gossypium stocksii]
MNCHFVGSSQAMTTTTRLSRNANFSIFKLSNSSDAALNLGPCSHKNVCSFEWKLHSQPCFIHVNNFRKMEWSVRSNVDASGFDPSSSNGGRPRLIGAIQGIQTKLGVRIRELRKNLPMKILFFLVGFYCATAFATFIGQTGDWDILSAALAVFVVEGIGALMYRASLPLLNNVRSLITIFNYWKAGLSLGLFLDSFKYELDKITGFSNPLSFDLDVFALFV